MINKEGVTVCIPSTQGKPPVPAWDCQSSSQREKMSQRRVLFIVEALGQCVARLAITLHCSHRGANVDQPDHQQVDDTITTD